MIDRVKDAVVVGGSLSGLMNAIVLRHLGYSVHVLEKSAPETLESQAAGIRAGDEVHAFIERYIPNHDPNYAVITDHVDIMDISGQVITTIPATNSLRTTTWRIVHRMLKNALLERNDALPTASYQTGQRVHNVEREGEEMLVHFENLDTNTSKALRTNLVIAADGAHSSLRRKLLPEVVPQYAGYVTWRGRVPESAVSKTTWEALNNRCVVLRLESGYQISYYVPAEGRNSTLAQRDFVWIWYDFIPGDSPLFSQTFTDVDGKTHSTTIPRGKMHPQVWQGVLSRKASVKNPYLTELMDIIEEPFVSAIRDFAGSKAVFHDGKVLLVGDAMALCRPHGGGSTNQAAFQARLLAKVLRGEMALGEWEKACLESAAREAQFSLGFGKGFMGSKLG